MENIQVYEFIENGLKPIEYTLSNNLNRAYVGGKTLIKPSKKKNRNKISVAEREGFEPSVRV